MVHFHSIVRAALLNTRIVSINCWQIAAHVSYLLEHYIRVHSLGRGGSFEVRYLVHSNGQAVVAANFFALDGPYTYTILFRVQWAHDWLDAFCCLPGLLLWLSGNEFLLKLVLMVYICIYGIQITLLKCILLIRSNKMQQYAGIYLLQNPSTCFGYPSHSSSGVHKTVTAASGTGHSIWATTFLQRGL